MKIQGFEKRRNNGQGEYYSLTLNTKTGILSQDSSYVTNRLGVNLREFHTPRQIGHQAVVDYFYWTSTTVARVAKLFDVKTKRDSRYALAALTLNNDGTGSIGCTTFDADNMTKILKAIFRSK